MTGTENHGKRAATAILTLGAANYPLFSQRRALRNVRAALTDEEFALVVAGSAKLLLRLYKERLSRAF